MSIKIDQDKKFYLKLIMVAVTIFPDEMGHSVAEKLSLGEHGPQH